jgi:uncharacterized protein (TIGR02646 family)
MKYIRKDRRREPNSLRNFRENTPNARYGGLPGDVKQDIRNVLIHCSEQGYLCAYCMRRIKPSPEYMVIEHFIPQNRHPNSPLSEDEHRANELLYQNILGTCQGFRNCSEIRENTPLVVDPRDPACERLIKFRKDGSIYSENESIIQDIETLKLELLTDQRREVIDKARKDMQRFENWTNERIDREIERWKTPIRTRHGLAFQEYCMAAVSYLETKKK